MDRLIALPCTIRPGAFSGERIFEVQLPNGETHESMAPRQRFYLESNSTLSAEEPQESEIQGYVVVRLLKRGASGTFVVALPDGKLVEYPKDRATSVPEEIADYVPI